MFLRAVIARTVIVPSKRSMSRNQYEAMKIIFDSELTKVDLGVREP